MLRFSALLLILFALTTRSARAQEPVQSLSVSTVAVGSDGQVYLSADYGPEKFVIVYAPDRGTELWQTEVDAETSSTPTICRVGSTPCGCRRQLSPRPDASR